MADRNRRKKKNLPVKWIAGGIAAAVLAGIALALLPGKAASQKTVPAVHSAAEAMAYLESRGADLGYENALSELTEIRSASVSGDSYYRLQQNYRGIPVFGRTVVYSADENGMQLSVTQNLQDVPAGLNLNPTAREEQLQHQLLAYLAQTYPESDWAVGFANEDLTVLPQITRSAQQLRIYMPEDSAYLVYEIRIGSLCLLQDAHSGQVLHSMQTIQSSGSWSYAQGSDEGFSSFQLPDGTYAMADVENRIYVYDANHDSYWNAITGNMHPEELTLITSPDRIFGDDNDNEPDSIKGAQLLNLVKDIRFRFFQQLGDPGFTNPMVLVYDDMCFNFGFNAGGGVLSAEGYAPELFPGDTIGPEESIAVITVGTVFSDDLNEHLDTIAHEYAHIITRRDVGWTESSIQNKALNEAFSDVFGVLYEAYARGTEPDWEIAGRPLSDPHTEAYPKTMTDPMHPIDQEHYSKSTIISHTAYLMWHGVNGNDSKKLSQEALAELWYRAMLMLPANANFEVWSEIMWLAANEMGLTEEQLICVRQALEQTGIENEAICSNVDFQVAELFSVDVWDADRERCTDCQVIIRKGCPAYGPTLPTDEPIVWNSSDSERCHMKLEPGFYTLTLNVPGYPETTQTYEIQVMPEEEGLEEVSLYVNQGNSILDLEIRGNVNGKEIPVSDAVVEVYWMNPRELAYMVDIPESENGFRLYLPADRYYLVVSAPGYAPEEAEVDLRDMTIRSSQSFLLNFIDEEIPEGPLKPPAEITGGAPYEVLTWEQSYTSQTDDITWTNRYIYDYISLLGDDPAYRVINRDLYALAEESMERAQNGGLYDPHYDQGSICGDFRQHTATRVMHNGNGIISILLDPYNAVTYSLYNGARLGLQILTGDEQELYLRNIQKAIQESYPYMQNVSELTLADIDFVIMDGEIVVLNLGHPASRMVHTGLYVSTEYTDRLRGTMRATGGAGSADYEIQTWDVSDTSRGYPDCLQTLIYVCEYPVFSGAPASSQMNQEVYALAAEFMTSLPRELTQTPNRFEYHLECNRFWSDERISTPYAGVLYNENGILSYVMQWNILYNHYVNRQEYIGSKRDKGFYGTVYDLQTGNKLTLPEITGMDERTQLLMLRDAYGRVYNRHSFNTTRIDYDPTEFSLEDPAFLVAENGQIVLHFTVTEEFDADYLASLPKTASRFTVTLPTGMYVLP